MLQPIRSSSPELLCKKGVLQNFPKFTGKHLSLTLFFDEVAGLIVYNFVEKETLAQVFSWEFYEISKNIFFYRTPSVAAFQPLYGRKKQT